MIIARQQLGEAAPWDRSLLETFLGAQPGQIGRDLKMIKTLFIVSTAVTVGIALVQIALMPKR